MQLAKWPLPTAYRSREISSCLFCQWRSFSTSYRRNVEKETPPLPPSPLDEAPRAYGKQVAEYTPKPLNRPIGLPNPPRAGENSGVDYRTWKQKRDDFVNYDKHLEKRKRLTQQISTPYFREWTNMRHHKGKSFISAPRIFKSDKALYFPNLQGQTLVKKTGLRDTTSVLEGKISVVSVFSSAWAEGQAASFVAEKRNPELHEAVRESGGMVQVVNVNIEENAMKAALIQLFMPSLRKKILSADWGRYFIVRKGMTQEIRDAIGLLNSKVGYVYLLDRHCRIRWAGSGVCESDERDGLVRSTRRLIEEAKERKVENLSMGAQSKYGAGTRTKEPIIKQTATAAV